jgi:hypothetical protein
LATLVGVAIVVGLMTKFALSGVLRPLQDWRRAYQDWPSLALVGTNRIHLPAVNVAEYQRVAARLRSDCDRFISVPGLNSFYLWTDKPPPTGMNTGDWMFLLDDDQQQRVVDAVRGVDRLCLVRSDQGLIIWVIGSGTSAAPERPLTRFIERTRWREVDSAFGGYYRVLVRSQSPTSETP